MVLGIAEENKGSVKKQLVILIGLVWMAGSVLPIAARNKQSRPESISVERRQQFDYYWYAAKHAINQGRFADALVLMEFCHALNPADGTTLRFLGTLQDATNQPQRAFNTYKQAYEVDPKDQWYKYSVALLEQRTPQSVAKATEVLEQAARLNPDNEDILQQLERLYISEEQWKKALRTQDKIDQLKGFDAYSALAYYRIYSLTGKSKKAMEALDRYLELDPNDIQFLFFRLQVLEQTKAKQEVLYPAYEKILAIDPGNLTVLNNYAYHLATHNGDLKRAEKMSEITIREQPDNPVFLDTYGWIMHLQGQHSLALFYLNRAHQYATSETSQEIENHLQTVQKNIQSK